MERSLTQVLTARSWRRRAAARFRRALVNGRSGPRPEGLPGGFVINFRMNHGKPELLLDEPVGSPTIRAKQ
jgi:hypothetical protein